MTSVQEKRSHIFSRFIIISISFLLFFSFFDWMIFLSPVYEPFDENFIFFFLPSILGWIPVVLFLRKKIKELGCSHNQKSWLYFFLIVTITIPTIIMQLYLQAATGKLTHLNTITDYSKTNPARFYQLDHFFLQKEKPLTYGSSSLKGKYNRDLEYRIDILVPVFAAAADTTAGGSSFYLVQQNTITISNKISNTEKDDEWQRFSQQTMDKYQSTDFARFVYLRREGNTNDHERFRDAVKHNPDAPQNESIFFTPVNEPFEKRTGYLLPWVSGSFIIGCFFILIVLRTVSEPAGNYFLTRNKRKQ